MSSKDNEQFVAKVTEILNHYSLGNDTFDKLFGAVDEYAQKKTPTEQEKSNEYVCNDCGVICSSVIELMDHNLIVHENAFDNQYTCDKCSYIGKTYDEIDEHYAQAHPIEDGDGKESDNDDDQDNKSDDESTLSPVSENAKVKISKIKKPNISIDIDSPVSEVGAGEYNCPICVLKFNSQFSLGDHFLASHQSYEAQKELDINTTIYFTGFDMLHMIGMIHFLDNDELRKINDECCLICRSNYTISIIKRTQSCTQFDKLKTPFDKSSFQKIEDAIKETVATPTDEITIFDHAYPIMMTCCKKYVCHNCLKQHIMGTRGIVCPFCAKDHTREDMMYVTQVEPSLFNKSAWQEWWSRHDDIFL